MGLLATGGVLVYVQGHRSHPPQKPRLVEKANPAARTPAPRLPAPKSLPPAVAKAIAPAAPASVCPQPIAPRKTPEIDLRLPAPSLYLPVTEFFPSDRPNPTTPLSLEIGRLGTEGTLLELGRAGGAIALPKKLDDDKPLKLNVSNMTDIGPQYPLIKSDDTTFLGRLAGGYSHDYPGATEGIVEVLFGCQLEHQLTHYNKVTGAVEYACDPIDFGRYRVRSQAAWEVLLDSDKNLSLRTSVLDSSNYAPKGEQAKNRNYSLDLIWKF
jgi:hypothetical protein